MVGFFFTSVFFLKIIIIFIFKGRGDHPMHQLMSHFQYYKTCEQPRVIGLTGNYFFTNYKSRLVESGCWSRAKKITRFRLTKEIYTLFSYRGRNWNWIEQKT